MKSSFCIRHAFIFVSCLFVSFQIHGALGVRLSELDLDFQKKVQATSLRLHVKGVLSGKGSGVYIGNGWLLSAAHVAPKNEVEHLILNVFRLPIPNDSLAIKNKTSISDSHENWDFRYMKKESSIKDRYGKMPLPDLVLFRSPKKSHRLNFLNPLPIYPGSVESLTEGPEKALFYVIGAGRKSRPDQEPNLAMVDILKRTELEELPGDAGRKVINTLDRSQGHFGALIAIDELFEIHPGDSGAPVIAEMKNGDIYLVGIVSVRLNKHIALFQRLHPKSVQRFLKRHL